MATLEVFNGNDQGYNAIAKIDRNTIAINQELGSALPKTDIINNLTSTDTTKALAAPQGKILDDKISNSLVSPNFTGAPTIKTKTIATTDKIDILFAFVDGISVYDPISYPAVLTINESLRTCRLRLSMKHTDNSVFNTTPTIGNIQSTYKPKSNIDMVLNVAVSGSYPSEKGRLIVRSTGVCTLYSDISGALSYYGTIEWDY